MKTRMMKLILALHVGRKRYKFMPKYVPDRGDIVWLDLNPQAGQEKSGRRPACVVSPKNYNRKTGFALICPVTSRVKGYPYEVLIPEGLIISGVILSDQIKSLDWRVRKADYICALPEDAFEEIQGKALTLIE